MKEAGSEQFGEQLLQLTLDVVKRVAKRLVIINESKKSTTTKDDSRDISSKEVDELAGFLLIVTKCKLELNSINENIPRTTVRYYSSGSENQKAPTLRLTERQKKLTAVWNELDLKVRSKVVRKLVTN